MTNPDEWIDQKSDERKTAPSDATALAALETDYETRIVYLKIACGEAHWFEIVVRNHDGSNEEVIDNVRHPSDGETFYDGDLEDYVYDYGADKEFTVKVDGDVGAGVDVAVKVKAKEHKA